MSWECTSCQYSNELRELAILHVKQHHNDGTMIRYRKPISQAGFQAESQCSLPRP